MSRLRGLLSAMLAPQAPQAPQAPEAVTPVTPAAVGAAPAAEGDPARPRVLVVEDNDVNQVVAEGILASLGYDSDVAGDGREALDALEHTAYAAVLMDCQMPVLDGYDATRELRLRELTQGRPRVPVLAMTASVTEGERERCAAAGMDDFVPKPVTPADLGAALDRWVARAS